MLFPTHPDELKYGYNRNYLKSVWLGTWSLVAMPASGVLRLMKVLLKMLAFWIGAALGTLWVLGANTLYVAATTFCAFLLGIFGHLDCHTRDTEDAQEAPEKSA